ncbi:MAG: leucyl/phenylalanyl-tRNA--protein transferase [Acidimicrobiales bacterium]
MPVEPPPTPWYLPDPLTESDGDLVGVGADLAAGTILAAYRAGMFPMPIEGQLAWWSPDPRAVLPLTALRVTRSLRKACGRFEIRVDTAFEEVIDACADPSRPGGWISDDIRAAYLRLHALGWAHSVEAWSSAGLAGGLYGVAIGGLFAGESMFHRESDASKAALVGLVGFLSAADPPVDDRLIDVQWQTDHLASLGVIEVPRPSYLALLGHALAQPLPAVFGGPA